MATWDAGKPAICTYSISSRLTVVNGGVDAEKGFVSAVFHGGISVPHRAMNGAVRRKERSRLESWIQWANRLWRYKMNSKIRPNSFSGRMGSRLGATWRDLTSKLVRTQGLPRHIWVAAAGNLLCLLGLAAVALAFTLLVIANLAVVLVRSRWENTEPVASREDSAPDYLGADLYIGDYDSNGHYIGDSKSPD